MEIRTEKVSDYDDVFQLNYLAFKNREDESRLIERIRLSKQFIPELSLVAEENNHIVGHALFSKAEVIDGEKNMKLSYLLLLQYYQVIRRKE
jgi:putative acetyltransferase